MQQPSHLMPVDAVKKKTLDLTWGYYIDRLNGHLYVADRKIVFDNLCKIIENSQDWFIVEEAYDDVPRKTKFFKTKEAAINFLNEVK